MTSIPSRHQRVHQKCKCDIQEKGQPCDSLKANKIIQETH